MGFRDELRNAGAASERQIPRYTLDNALIEKAANELLEEMKAVLKSNAASGKVKKEGILGTRRSVTATIGIGISRSNRNTPFRSVYTDGEGYENACWLFHDTVEVRLVARRMSQLGASDGIRVTFGDNPKYPGNYHFFAEAKY